MMRLTAFKLRTAALLLARSLHRFFFPSRYLGEKVVRATARIPLHHRLRGVKVDDVLSRLKFNRSEWSVQHVLLAGAGSMGQQLAPALARLGLRISITDQDKSEWANGSRGVLPAGSVGEPKAHELVRFLAKTTFSGVELEGHFCTAEELLESTRLASPPTLIIAAVDSDATRRSLSEFCVAQGIACILLGVEADSSDPREGYVFSFVPGQACGCCYLDSLSSAEESNRHTYGDEVAANPGLTNQVAARALQHAVRILSGEQPSNQLELVHEDGAGSVIRRLQPKQGCRCTGPDSEPKQLNPTPAHQTNRRDGASPAVVDSSVAGWSPL